MILLSNESEKGEIGRKNKTKHLTGWCQFNFSRTCLVACKGDRARVSLNGTALLAHQTTLDESSDVHSHLKQSSGLSVIRRSTESCGRDKGFKERNKRLASVGKGLKTKVSREKKVDPRQPGRQRPVHFNPVSQKKVKQGTYTSNPQRR